MNTLEVSLYDGEYPEDITLNSVPAKIQELMEEIARLYPARGKLLLEKSFSDDFIQDYTFFLNRVLVKSREQALKDGDKLVILSSIAGG